MPTCRHASHLYSAALSALTCVLSGQAFALEQAQLSNPIGRIARAFDSELVKTEDRVSWLDNRVSTYAQHREHAMKVGLGYRGYRAKSDSPDPSVTLDLGAEYPVNKVFLVPVQREFLEDQGIFPQRYTLEISTRPDFAQRTILYTSAPNGPARVEDGNPVPFSVGGDNARYVRLTVHQGHNKGMLDLFGLSEIAVISKRDPVSFGASVSTVGDLNATGIWYPDALTDGRTPLGIWQNGGKPKASAGDFVSVSSAGEEVSWTIALDQQAPLDRIVLFPYQLDRSFESSVFPDSLTFHVRDSAGTEEELVYEWHNPLPGASSMTPLVIPLNGKPAVSVRVTGARPCMIGEMNVQALSEIEVWSGGKNLSSGKTVTRSYGGEDTAITSLTDGYASDKQIIPFSVWLEQLHERGRIERELAMLRPVHRQLSSESELNATWG
ncbi:MAG: discoidin domain-containing protein, partial [Verrucomicrobiaceae bacterium]